VSAKAADQYLTSMQNDFAKEQTATWLPLSQDHAAWLNSRNLAHVFQYDYDTQDPLSGLFYEGAFTACIKGSTERKEAFDLLSKWLQGAPDDNTNLLLRALCLNLDKNVSELKSAAGFPVSEMRETLAKGIDSWFAAAKAINAKAPQYFADFYLRGAKLVYEVGAPIAKVVSNGVDTAAAKTAVYLASVRTGNVVVYRPVKGTQSQWISHLESFGGGERRASIDKNRAANRVTPTTMLWRPTKPLCVSWAMRSQTESLSVHWAEAQARTADYRRQQRPG
jgi:hypothetical protein